MIIIIFLSKGPLAQGLVVKGIPRGVSWMPTSNIYIEFPHRIHAFANRASWAALRHLLNDPENVRSANIRRMPKHSGNRSKERKRKVFHHKTLMRVCAENLFKQYSFQSGESSFVFAASAAHWPMIKIETTIRWVAVRIAVRIAVRVTAQVVVPVHLLLTVFRTTTAAFRFILRRLLMALSLTGSLTGIL